MEAEEAALRHSRVQDAHCLLAVPHQVRQTPRAGEWGPCQARCGREVGAEEVSLTVLWGGSGGSSLVLVQRHVFSQGCSWCLGLVGVQTGFSWHLILTRVCRCFPLPRSTISSILGAWLDQYSEDFRKPPDFTCLKQLISYVCHNIPGSDLERRARILLAQFQQQEQSESEAEGGVLSPFVGGHLGLRVERVLLLGIKGLQNLRSCHVGEPP